MPRNTRRNRITRTRYNLNNYRGIAVRYTLDEYPDTLTHQCPTVNGDPDSPNFRRQVLPPMTLICPHCQALLFPGETPKICCSNGNTALLPLYPELPHAIFYLWQTDPEFRRKIRKYNQAMSLCSLLAIVDEELANDQNGIYTFRVKGQIHHMVGPAEAHEGERPKFSQIYFFERETQIEHRLHWYEDLNPVILGILHDVIVASNPQVALFLQASEIPSHRNYRIVFKSGNSVDQRRYNAPTVAEVGCILLDNEDEQICQRDVVMTKRTGGLKHINEFNKQYDAFMYPLLLPYGSDGWHDDIYLNGHKITPKAFTTFHLMVRDIKNHPERNPLHLGGKLLQQWCVDQQAKIESNNLNWIRDHQTEIRADLYNNIEDAIDNGHVRIGRRIILPSTFRGGERYMNQCYQDSMAIVRVFGKADLFVTMTCNPKWSEIEAEMLEGQTAQDRPDVVTRVFNMSSTSTTSSHRPMLQTSSRNT
jgi:Helitron helicase-like domain at N-terminus